MPNPTHWVDPLGLASKEYETGNPKDGSDRAKEFSSNWPGASKNEAVNKFAGPNPNISVTDKGKRIYENPETKIQVVEDLNGNYFRVYDPNLPGKRKYLDMDGNVPNNKVLPNGKTAGRNQGEYNMVTHFNITD